MSNTDMNSQKTSVHYVSQSTNRHFFPPYNTEYRDTFLSNKKCQHFQQNSQIQNEKADLEYIKKEKSITTTTKCG